MSTSIGGDTPIPAGAPAPRKAKQKTRAQLAAAKQARDAKAAAKAANANGQPAAAPIAAKPAATPTRTAAVATTPRTGTSSNAAPPKVFVDMVEELPPRGSAFSKEKRAAWLKSAEGMFDYTYSYEAGTAAGPIAKAA